MRTTNTWPVFEADHMADGFFIHLYYMRSIPIWCLCATTSTKLERDGLTESNTNLTFPESCQVRLFIISLSSFVSIDTKIAVRASSFSPYFLQSWVPWQSKLDFLTMFIRKSLTVFTFNCNIKWVQIQWYFTTSYKMASGFQTSVNLDLNLDANIFTITMQIIHFFVKTCCNRNYGNETVVSLQLNSLKVTK